MRKTQFIKIIALLLASFMMLSAFASCKKEEVEPVNYIDISNYNMLIRPETTTADIVKAANSLKLAIASTCGINMQMKTDLLKFGETVPNDTYEILIGSTNRDASVNTLNELADFRPNNANDYKIAVVGNKIVISGPTDAATISAVDYFIDTVLPELAQNKTPDNYEYIYRQEYDMITLAGNPITDYTLMMDENPSDEVKESVDVLVETVTYLSGYILPITTDSAFSGKVIKLSTDGSNLDEVRMSFDGDNLNITAGHFIPLRNAVIELASMFTNSRAYESTFVLEKEYDTIPLSVEKYPELKLVWYDEFEYTDGQFWTDKWSAQSVPATVESLNKDIIESEEEKNMFVDEDGNFVLRVLNDGTAAKPYSVPKHLTTKDTMNWTYGYLEVRAKVPTGSGFWPSLWTMQREDLRIDEKWSAEIDIFESFAAKDKFVTNMHIWYNNGYLNSSLDKANNKDTSYSYKTSTASEEWHVFGFYWDSEKMVFSIDGVDYCEVDLVKGLMKHVSGAECPIGEDGLDVFRSPMYLLIGNPIFTPGCNFVGGGVPGEDYNPNMLINENSPMPADYVIDYVRLYQGTDGVLITTPQE